MQIKVTRKKNAIKCTLTKTGKNNFKKTPLGISNQSKIKQKKKSRNKIFTCLKFSNSGFNICYAGNLSFFFTFHQNSGFTNFIIKEPLTPL